MGRNIEDFIDTVKKDLEALKSLKNRIEAELNIIDAIADIMSEIGVKMPVKDFEIYSITENTPVERIYEALRNDVIKALCGVLGGLLDVKVEGCECMDKVIDSVIGNYGQWYDSRLRSLSIYGQYRELLGNYVRNCMSGDVCEFLDYLLEGKVEEVLGNLFREFDILRDKMREFGIDTGKLVNCFIRPCKTEELVAEMMKVSSALSKLIFMSNVLGKLSVSHQGSVESKSQSLWISKVSNLVRELSNVSRVIEETKANLKGMLESSDAHREDCISLISGVCGKALDSINDGLSRIKSTISTISAMISLAKGREADVDDIEKSANSIINCVDYLSGLIKTDTGISTGDSQCQDINKHVGRLMMRDLGEVIEKGLSDSEREVLSKILEVLGTTGQVSIKELAERLSEQELITLAELCKRGILTCVVRI